MQSTSDRAAAARQAAASHTRRQSLRAGVNEWRRAARRPWIDRLADTATREHTWRDELRIVGKCLLLGTVVGLIACLFLGGKP